MTVSDEDIKGSKTSCGYLGVREKDKIWPNFHENDGLMWIIRIRRKKGFSAETTLSMTIRWFRVAEGALRASGR
jgi:hypothetical protein